jgi:succinate dehydrogenase hydrophobic anchor subunit
MAGVSTFLALNNLNDSKMDQIATVVEMFMHSVVGISSIVCKASQMKVLKVNLERAVLMMLVFTGLATSTHIL